jgi:hypothetical protein
MKYLKFRTMEMLMVTQLSVAKKLLLTGSSCNLIGESVRGSCCRFCFFISMIA